MKPVEFYKGREQTYLKHFFLENYLEKVIYKVGFYNPNFTYVDGFSGPWKSEDENYQDTSFGIALNKLRATRENLSKHKKYLNLRCLFIEKTKKAFNELEKQLKVIDDIETKAIHGQFEEVIPEIESFLGNSFSFIFIDPRGWTGYALNKIEPVFKPQGEVLINFMFDYINRFKNFQDSKNIETFNNLFGYSNWKIDLANEKSSGKSDEEAILTIYLNQLKKRGNFPYVTFTKILKPITERSYFHLLYGTRHLEGLRVFREVEKKFFDKQIGVRNEAKQRKRVEKTKQQDLFEPKVLSGDSDLLEKDRENNLKKAKNRLIKILKANKQIKGQKIFGELLIDPFVWEKDINDWIMEMKKSGKIEIPNMSPRERTLKSHHLILPKF